MAPSPPHVIEDCRGALQLLSDGSIRRPSSSLLSSVPLHHDPTVLFVDLQFDPAHSLSLRLYKPTSASPLPLLFYFHGGGFCIGSFAHPLFHNACLRLASSLPALVAAPDYRLAPESPLPAALHDSAAALSFVLSGAGGHPFLAAADLRNVFISGESAGGNLAHHLNLRFGPRVRGYLLLLPFFGGTRRTASEEGCEAGAFLDLEQSDRYWRLALPAGATRDDPVANPFTVEGGQRWGEVEVGPVVVVVGGRDLLRDRGVEYGRRLKEMGKRAEVVVIEGQDHGFFPMNPRSAAADELVGVVKRFMEENRAR